MDFNTPACWYEGVYRDKARVVSAARPFMICNNNSSAVLLIHGYAGYPGELVRPAIDIAKFGFDVYCPRLPGMGSSGKDFLSSTREDWIKTIDNVLSYLDKKYKSISIVSHSMGTLLALIATKKHDIDKIVLAAPAFSMPQLKSYQMRLISIFKKDIKIDWKPDNRYKLYYENAPCDDLELGKEYWSHLYPKRLLDLLELKKEALKLDNYNSKVLIIKCGKDAVTSPNGCDDYIHSHNVNASIEYIENATHFVYYDIDKEAEERAVKATVEFLAR